MTSLRKGSRLLLGLLSLAAIAIATLPPTSSANSPSGLCIVCGDRGAADAFLNVLLFVPLGVAFRLNRFRVLTAMLAGAALTFCIELAQLTLISGRDASIADLLWNTVGVGAGYLLTAELPALVKPNQVRARILAFTWLGLITALPFVAAFALKPSVAARTYFWQWTPELGDEREYEGELVSARLDDRPVSRSNVPFSREMERAVAWGTLELDFVAAHPVPVRTTLFAIANERSQQLVRIAIKGEDITINVRRRSRNARFDYPVLRFPGAMRGVGEGDTVRLHVNREPSEVRIALSNGVVAKAPTRVSRSWMLLYAGGSDGSPLEALLSKIFVFGLLLPLGYWSARGRCLPLCAAAGAAAVLILPLALGMDWLSWGETAVGLFAVALGAGLARNRLPVITARSEN